MKLLYTEYGVFSRDFEMLSHMIGSRAQRGGKIVSEPKISYLRCHNEVASLSIPFFCFPGSIGKPFFASCWSVTMAIFSQTAARCCRQVISRTSPSCSLRSSSASIAYFSQQRQRRTPATRRWQSTEAAASQSAPSNPKIEQIVDQISKLTLLETADLVASLKVGSRLAISAT